MMTTSVNKLCAITAFSASGIFTFLACVQIYFHLLNVERFFLNSSENSSGENSSGENSSGENSSGEENPTVMNSVVFWAAVAYFATGLAFARNLKPKTVGKWQVGVLVGVAGLLNVLADEIVNVVGVYVHPSYDNYVILIYTKVSMRLIMIVTLVSLSNTIACVMSNIFSLDTLASRIVYAVLAAPIIRFAHYTTTGEYQVITHLVFLCFGCFISNALIRQVPFDYTALYIPITVFYAITATFSYHQGFNVTVFLITQTYHPVWASILINLSVQMVGSVVQAVVGYKTNLLRKIMTSPKDIRFVIRFTKDFQNLTLWKSIVLGYKLNALGDSVYSLAWGELCKRTKQGNKLVWSSMTKEFAMLLSTILMTLARHYPTTERLLYTCAFMYITINFFFSWILLKPYYEDNNEESAILEDIEDEPQIPWRNLSLFILTLVATLMAVLVSYNVISLTVGVIFCSVVNTLIAIDFILNIYVM